MMPKMNVMLEDAVHEVLLDYKKRHKYPNLDKTINEYVKDVESRKQLFR